MKHLHLEKKGLRGLAIAESFKQFGTISRLGGIVVRRDFIIDGFIMGQCTVEGDDLTDGILDMYSRLDRTDVSFVMVSGLIMAMYNIVDMKKIYDKIKIPMIGVTYEESDGLEDAIIHHFPTGFEKKIEQYKKLETRTKVTLHTGHNLYLRTEGCQVDEARLLIDLFTLQGSMPEPLRLAQLLARTEIF